MTRTLDPDLVEAAVTSCAEARGTLLASRARVAAAADETRRRVQHDLHHGAQERLAHAVVALKLAREALAAGRSPVDLIDEALTQAARASSQLSQVLRGILPPILVHGGLHLGVESLVADLALVAEVRVTVPRLPAAAETAAYLVVAEALTNVAAHACANRVSAGVELEGDVLTIEVRDDGVGGADPARGTGLTGLIDRVDAAGGYLTITSPAGAGTVLRAVLPVDRT
jgi:signal transduction histidine kinase